MRTANPALNEGVWSRYADDSLEKSRRMTVGGTINRSLVLLGILAVPAVYTWKVFARDGVEAIIPFLAGGLIGGVVLALVTTFKAPWAAVTAPLYAIAQGFFLGGLSALVESRLKGVVFQSVTLTFCIFFAMLVLYSSRTIRATEKFRAGVLIATCGIGLVYLASWLLGIFAGVSIPFIHEGGAIGIGFSLFVIVIAALNFVLDFDLIERGVAGGAPRYMEWFGAFGLLVTLVWLYIEVLRLLAKIRGRN